MGFSNFGYGCLMPCGVKDGSVILELPSGMIIGYPTHLEVTLPLQTNLYFGKTIAFLLEDEEKEYIGRFDGSITIVRKSDGLLVGLNNWDAPKHPRIKSCGLYLEKGISSPVYIDLNDNQSLYVQDLPISSKLRTPYSGDFNELDSTMSSLIDVNVASHIYTKGGMALGTEVWNIQTSVRGRNCRIFF